MTRTFRKTPTGWLALLDGLPLMELVGEQWLMYGNRQPVSDESAARLTFALVKWLANAPACFEPKETT